MGRFVKNIPSKKQRIPPGILVDVSGFLPILSHKRFEMLDDKNQLGMLHKVYRGAHHKRYEHSLGTFEIAQRMLRQMDLPEEEARARLVFALLHDAAHVPFCHDLGAIMDIYHDTKGVDFLPDFKEAIEACGIDYKRVVELFKAKVPPTKGGKIMLEGKPTKLFLCADMLDYMFRDPYGVTLCRTCGRFGKDYAQFLSKAAI